RSIRERAREPLRVSPAEVLKPVAVHVGEPDRAPLLLLIPAGRVAPSRTVDASRKAVSVGQPALHPRRRAGAYVGAPVSIHVPHPDRSVVARLVPAAPVRPARPLDAPLEAATGREPTAEARAVARAEILSSVAVHVGEAEGR